MNLPDTIILKEAQSTNTWLAQNSAGLRDMACVSAVAQTSGRGQRGNSWEAEAGKNLTVSILHLPQNFAARNQFSISEAVALGVTDTLAGFGIPAKIKWPNDIYYKESKLCGILIEHAVAGINITRTIIGIGLNVNQTHFVSDAPNPISMALTTGNEYPLERVLESLRKNVGRRISEGCATDSDRQKTHSEFIAELWRNDGEQHPFYDKQRSETISARVADVEPCGLLHLVTDRGEEREYAFKEVEWLL